MTTIAYRDGVIAADTLMTWGNGRDGYASKIASRDGLLAAASGTCAGCQAFLDWFRAGCHGDAPLPSEGDALWFGLVITADDWILTRTPHGWERTRDQSTALGSGAEYAKGAMSAGVDAEAAVRIAILHDTKSGGAVQVLRR